MDALGFSLVCVVCDNVPQVWPLPNTKGFRQGLATGQASIPRSGHLHTPRSVYYGGLLYQLRLLCGWVGSVPIRYQLLLFVVCFLQSKLILILQQVPIEVIDEAFSTVKKIVSRFIFRKIQGRMEERQQLRKSFRIAHSWSSQFHTQTWVSQILRALGPIANSEESITFWRANNFSIDRVDLPDLRWIFKLYS